MDETDADQSIQPSQKLVDTSTHGKRKRLKTNRYGSFDNGNKDAYFENENDSSNSNTANDPLFELPKDEDSDGVSFQDNEPESLLPNGLNKQVARIEAKLNFIQSIVTQIHRMVISNAIADTANFDEKVLELPLYTKEALEHFEQDLEETSYEKKIFKHLVTINGLAGHKGGSKIVRSVVFATLSPELLCQYTFHGRSKCRKKMRFGTMKNTIQLIHNVINAYDKTYSKMKCEEDLKLKIFKYIKKTAGALKPDTATIPNRQLPSIQIAEAPIQVGNILRNPQLPSTHVPMRQLSSTQTTQSQVLPFVPSHPYNAQYPTHQPMTSQQQTHFQQFNQFISQNPPQNGTYPYQRYQNPAYTG